MSNLGKEILKSFPPEFVTDILESEQAKRITTLSLRMLREGVSEAQVRLSVAALTALHVPPTVKDEDTFLIIAMALEERLIDEAIKQFSE